MVCDKTCLSKDTCEIIGCIFRHPLVDSSSIQWFLELGENLTLAQCLSVFEKIEPTTLSKKKALNNGKGIPYKAVKIKVRKIGKALKVKRKVPIQDTKICFKFILDSEGNNMVIKI